MRRPPRFRGAGTTAVGGYAVCSSEVPGRRHSLDGMRPVPLPLGRSACALVLLTLLLAACSGGDGKTSPAPSASSSSTEGPRGATETLAEPVVYLAVGASETVGVGADDPASEAWPQVLRDTALPGAALVNVGVSGATVQGALATQLPEALAAEVDVATVWLAVNDVIAQVPVAAYERRLGRLVAALRSGGDTEVLVGNVPQLWRLPVYRSCLDATEASPCVLPLVPSEAQVRARVAAFNAAIDRVVRRTGALLVDLSREVDVAELVSQDGFHPSTEGHRRIAEAFAERLPRRASFVR